MCVFIWLTATRIQFSSTNDQGSLQLHSQFKLSSTDAKLPNWFSNECWSTSESKIAGKACLEEGVLHSLNDFIIPDFLNCLLRLLRQSKGLPFAA